MRLSLLSRKKIFFVLVKIFKIKTFESRLGLVEILVETVKIVEFCQDLSRYCDIFKTFEGLQAQKS
jgi:hypothetical protein